MRTLSWCGAGAMLVLTLLAAWGERRRKRRADLDRVGLVDWVTVQVFALLGVLVFASFALNA